MIHLQRGIVPESWRRGCPERVAVTGARQAGREGKNGEKESPLLTGKVLGKRASIVTIMPS